MWYIGKLAFVQALTKHLMLEGLRLHHSMEVVNDLLQSVKATVLDWPTNIAMGHNNLLWCSIKDSLWMMLTHLTDDEGHKHDKDTSSSTDQDALKMRAK